MGDDVQPMDAEPGETAPAAAHLGDSLAQREAEPLMVAAVAKEIGVALAKKRLTLGGGSRPEVDGVSEDETVLVEAFAHQGKIVGGQIRKVSEDAFKLVTLARGNSGIRLILAFADDETARSFLGKSWRAEALKIWGVEVLVVQLDDDVRAGIRDAQVRQFR